MNCIQNILSSIYGLVWHLICWIPLWGRYLWMLCELGDFCMSFFMSALRVITFLLFMLHKGPVAWQFLVWHREALLYFMIISTYNKIENIPLKRYGGCILLFVLQFDFVTLNFKLHKAALIVFQLAWTLIRNLWMLGLFWIRMINDHFVDNYIH